MDWSKLKQRLIENWRKEKRWREADNRGWGSLGAALGYRGDPNSFRAGWLYRRCLRLGRLTRGSGNPWRDE